MITIRFSPSVLVTVCWAMRSWLRYAEWLEHSQVHFPPYMSFSFHCSLPAENSKCDNRGTINSNSRPCSCKVYLQYGQEQSEIMGLHYNHILSMCRLFVVWKSLTARWITYVHLFVCLFVCMLQNNVAGALCDECKAGFFHLSEANPDGCLRCFCMGVTKQCASSTWNRDQVQ